MDTTTVIAIYAAVVATSVFIFDLIKWYRASSISVDVQPNRKILFNGKDLKEGYMFVDVTAGDKGITITCLEAKEYTSKLAQLMRLKPLRQGEIPLPAYSPKFPHFLKPQPPDRLS